MHLEKLAYKRQEAVACFEQQTLTEGEETGFWGGLVGVFLIAKWGIWYGRNADLIEKAEKGEKLTPAEQSDFTGHQFMLIAGILIVIF